MKKAIEAIKKKRQESKGEAKPNLRITNDTVAEHREQVIADGRKFKYPVQYARHKLVINTVILSIIALSGFAVFTWWQLYQEKASNTFFYRVTQIVPLPVASIDGESVSYSNFLLFYRPSVHFLREVSKVDLTTEDGKRQVSYHQRQSLDKAIEAAYITKLAKENDIVASEAEVDEYIKKIRTAADDTISQQASDTSNRQIVGITADELRHFMRHSILHSKVAFAIDNDARNVSKEIMEKLKSDPDMVKAISKYKEQYGDRVVVRKGLSLDKSKMFAGVSGKELADIGKGKLSSIIERKDNNSYVIVKVTDSNETTVTFDFVQVTTSKLEKNIEELRAAGKVQEYIAISKEEDV